MTKVHPVVGAVPTRHLARVKLTDARNTVVGHFVLREIAEDGRWQLSVLRHGKWEAKTGDDPRDGSLAFRDALMTHFEETWRASIVAERERIESPHLFIRNGFRPGSVKRELGLIRSDRARVAREAEAKFPQFLAEIVKLGWPLVDPVPMPWAKEGGS